MNSSPSSCLESESNPQSDHGSLIYGPGIRISFYLQSIFLVILANRSSESEETVTAFPLWIISITNCSLFISALLLDEESKLPLLDALHTWNLLWLANVTIFLVLSTHPHQTKHPFRESRSLTQARESRIITLIKSLSLRLNYGFAVLQAFFTMGFTVYFYATAKTFNECLNTITYTIFIWSVPLPPGRVIALVSSIIATCIYIAILAWRAQWILQLQSINSWIPNADHDHDPSSPLPRLVPHFPRIFPKHNSPWTKPFAVWWRPHFLDDDDHRIGMSFGKSGLGMTVWVYMVVSNEFLLKENHAVDAYMFDFAQYNALFAAFPAAFAVFTVFYKPRSATNNYDDMTSDTLDT
ncbi:hypothetical protein C8R41DRAFT_843265 [Lentinula lateritia]|uniref:Fungal pheromone STE3G-protein-coupled receptor n=1 Tax=Lentinula lateritia TaxID=40482 RepID=A0ABQ8V7W4_9AGAR|nr:hypothetical protein C8R41DRAFT_843265 [Lentinula lateritia]